MRRKVDRFKPVTKPALDRPSLPLLDLTWQTNRTNPVGELADALVTEPVVLINPAAGEDPLLRRRLFRP
jgi:hypothetical protein